MRARHGKNVRGPVDQLGGERLGTEPADVDALLLEDLDRVEAGRLAADGVNAGGSHFDVRAAPEHLAKKPLGHGAAADVTGADEENAFHKEPGAPAPNCAN